MPRRSDPNPTKRITISLPMITYLEAKPVAVDKGFRNSFSAYLARLIEEDTKDWKKSQSVG